MMRRRASPSARTITTAPTAPRIPVDDDGVRVPRSVPPDAGRVTGNGSCTSVEGGSERSTGSPDEPLGPAAGHRRGGGRVRGRPARPAARRRVLGHRGVPDRRTDHGHGSSDGLPDVRAAGLARLGRPPAVRRPGVPDEPVVGHLPGGRRRGHGRSRPGPDRLGRAGDGGRARARPHADRLGHRHACRGARPAPRAAGGPAPTARRLGGPCPRPSSARSRRPLPGRRVGRLRVVGRQSLADAPAGRARRPVRARRGPRHLAPAPARPHVRGRAGDHARRRLPGAAAAGRPVPGRAGLRTAGHVGRFLVRRARGAVPRQPARPVRRPGGQGRRSSPR